MVLGRRAGATVPSSSVCDEGGAVLVAVQDASRRARARCRSGLLDRHCARRVGSERRDFIADRLKSSSDGGVQKRQVALTIMV